MIKTPLAKTAFGTLRLKLKNNKIHYLKDFAPRIPFSITIKQLLAAWIYPKTITQMANIFVSRHLAIDEEIGWRAKIHQNRIAVLEVACGFSPRGFAFALRGIPFYCDSDYSDLIIQRKKRLLEGAIKKYNCPQVAKTYRIIQLDVLSDSFSSILQSIDQLFPDYPIIIVAEGLIGYFNEVQRERFFKQITTLQRQKASPLYFVYPVKFAPRDRRSFPKTKLMRLFSYVFCDPEHHYTTHFLSTPQKARGYFFNKGFTQIICKNYNNISIVCCQK